MSIRGLDKIGLVVTFAIGAALTPDTISGEAGRMLVTFLGLVSASLLPTISLLINSMTASGRSVHAIQKLDAELQVAMDALFLLFGCAIVAVIALVALAIQPPEFLNRIPYLTSEILPRVGQAIVICAALTILLRAGQIPAILRRSLIARRQIAIEEAQRVLAENVPQPADIRKAFEKHPDFGKEVTMNELRK